MTAQVITRGRLKDSLFIILQLNVSSARWRAIGRTGDDIGAEDGKRRRNQVSAFAQGECGNIKIEPAVGRSLVRNASMSVILMTTSGCAPWEEAKALQ